MYPPHLLIPMRQDLTSVGFDELTTPEEVDQAIDTNEGTMLVMVNSVCGCAAGAARPGVKTALQRSEVKPDRLVTVFAGGDVEATARMRDHLLPYPPSSPAIGIFKNGELVHFIERHHIEGRSAEMIAQHLEMAFEEFCDKANA